MNRQTETRFDFQIAAMRAIKHEMPASPRLVENGRPAMTEGEMLEADVAHAAGVSGREFGLRIVARDRSTPIDLPKPLSEEHQRIIELLKEHHQHTDRPLVICESEYYVTLRIPKVRTLELAGRVD